GLPRLSCGCFRKSLEKLDVGSVPLIPDLALGNGVPSIGIVLGAETGLGAGTRRHGRVIALVEGIAEAIRPAVDLSVLIEFEFRSVIHDVIEEAFALRLLRGLR